MSRRHPAAGERMPRMGGRVAIAATGPVSLAAGREVALAGGNAVDVAVAAAMAAMSTEPGIVSLAGGAFIAFRWRDASRRCGWPFLFRRWASRCCFSLVNATPITRCVWRVRPL